MIAGFQFWQFRRLWQFWQSTIRYQVFSDAVRHIRSRCRKPDEAMKATVNKVKLYPMWMNTQRATDLVTARMAVSAIPTPNRISNGAQECANCSERSRAKPAAEIAVAGATPIGRASAG